MKKRDRLYRLICLMLIIINVTGCEKRQPVILPSSEIIDIKEVGEIDNIFPVQIKPSEQDIEEETEYRLMQFAELETIGNDTIMKGDIVSFRVTLLDDSNKVMEKFQDMEMDCIVGDYEFDSQIENVLLGRKSGDVLEIVNAEKTIFDNEGAKYYTLKIENVERFKQPKLTKSFLKEHFGVDNEVAFYELMKKETESVMYEMELKKTEDVLVEIVSKKAVFSDEYQKKIKDRYNELIKKYENYGKLYGMSLDEVLSTFEMDRNEVKENAKLFQTEWELVKYYIGNNEMKISNVELEQAKEKYAKENGYASIDELIKDSGEQYLLEQVLVGFMKDYLYEKYIGDILEYDN